MFQKTFPKWLTIYYNKFKEITEIGKSMHKCEAVRRNKEKCEPKGGTYEENYDWCRRR